MQSMQSVSSVVTPRRFRLWSSIALLAILLLAAGLRFYHIDQLPPGLHYDEAFNDLHALRMLRSGEFPVFIADEFGALPMHHWLIALLFRLTGPTPLGGRLVSAGAGTVTVGLLFFAVRELFHEALGERRATAAGLLAALALAILYWHVHYSRIGMEPIMTPTLAVGAFAFTWRALRRCSPWDALAAGALLGGTIYTYPAAYFVPLLMAFFFGLWALVGRGFLRAHWRELLVIAGVAMLVVVPLGIFAATHPEVFFHRSEQIVLRTMGERWREVRNLLAGFFVRGDINPRQNLPNRPMLDPLQGVLFFAGLGACLLRRRPAHLFLLAWLVVMFLPSALTEYAPHFGRALGAAPALAALIGLGGLELYERIVALARRWLPRARRALSAATVLLLAAAFAFSETRTAHDYFIVWANSPDLFIAFDVGLRWAGEAIAALPEEERVYLSPIYRDYPTLRFLLNDDAERIHSYDGRRCFVYPAETEAVTDYFITVMRHEDQRSLPRLQAAFPDGRVVEELPIGNSDIPYLVVYRVPAGSVAQIGPSWPLGINFDQRVRLLGYDLPQESFAAGETVPLRLYWQAQQPLDQGYKVFLHLYGTPSPLEGGQIWGQQDVLPCNGSYPFPWWLPGDVVVDEIGIPIRPDAPPGAYQIAAGLYLDEGPRLPVVDEGGAVVGDYVVVATIQVR